MSSLQDTSSSSGLDSCSLLDINTEDAVLYISNYIEQNALEGVDINSLPPPESSNVAFLDRIAELLLLPSLTECVGIAFYPILPALVGRWTARREERLEWIACALARLLYLDSRLKRHAQELLLPEPSFLRTISYLSPLTEETELQAQFWEIETDSLRETLLMALRLLIFDRAIFLSHIPLEPLVALLQHKDLSIRLLAIELYTYSIGLADASKQEWISHWVHSDPNQPVMAIWENKTIDFGVLLVFEALRVRESKKTIAAREYFRYQDDRRKLSTGDLAPYTGDVCGILIPRFGVSHGAKSEFVLTENTKINLRNVAKTIVDEKPLLLQSIPGAGKSFLIDEIAKLFGRYDGALLPPAAKLSVDIVRITLTDQTDAKLLLGTYVTDTPGSFAWRAGILTTAVREGKWIVIEDIERAGNDVLSVLLPLLEGRPLELAGRGQVEMSKGCQIIATTRLFSGPKSAYVENMLGIQRWSRVTVLPPTDDDLLTIIIQSHPRLSFIAPTLLQVYVALRDQSSPLGKSARPISPRDLFKWAKRTAFHCIRLTGETIPREIWEDIFLEAIDCFAAQIPSPQARAATIERIGAEMGFPTERVKLYLESHAPPLKNAAHAVSVGRVSVSKARGTPRHSTRPFAYTNHAKKLLEQLAVAHIHREPILLVGETGTGKTTIVQHLADLLHHRLIVVNVSQQTESSDLLGGFKPVDVRTLAVQLNESFEGLFEKTFSAKRNEAFLGRVREVYAAQNWTALVKLIASAVAQAEARFAQPAKDDEDGGAKKKRKVDSNLKAEWVKFADSLKSFEAQHASGKGKAQAFSFVEGSLVKALRRGDWLLLDEINLAASDTLESIAGLIRDGGSITLPEKGDLEAIKPHPDFRIFAAMNPATDVGKRDLPPALRGQFTELYVGSPDQSMADLLLIIKQYIGHLMVGDERSASDVANLYLRIKGAAERHEIVDGVGQKPHFSVRTLSRTLTYVGDTAGMYGLRRALYEGFCMSFTTMLEKSSRDTIVQAIVEGIYPSANRNVRSALRSLPKRPEGDVVQLGHYWIETGPDTPQENPQYIVKQHTSVEQNLHNLVRASVTRRYPILLQGPTSSGKTSMVEHLAKLTGHKFLRINNHEHTSLDEYLGTYISTPTGSFVFQEGVLVQALRKGHWIVLDELNLAPTDVLEALNRLLDDNRELLIPETQEVVRPHPHFMLFATQNPAGLYGGRKVLSRAFRNRFLELEFEDIPEHELEEILCLRCSIPPSYGAKVVEVYKQLSLRRQSTRLFEKGNSFATLRDLFRWAQREAVGYQQLAENGYMLLAERVRKSEERGVVKEVIEKVMRVKIDESSLYDLGRLGEDLVHSVTGVIWTKAMRRLFILVREALVNNEPVLLVGETGSGKTTVCQVLADYMRKELHVINAHQNTETGDIIGGQRPYRDRARYQAQLTNQLRSFFSDRPETTEMDLEGLSAEFGKLDVQSLLTSPETPGAITSHIEQIRESWNRHNILFEWVDGTLVQAMKQGEPFLLDEISLADDSVLERLNSVLESTRTIVLAEKGGEDVSVVAATGFQFFATMNPGGDYGKKELSPALRNRFTELWVPAVDDREDLVQISQASLVEGMKDAAEVIVEFAEWFTKNIGTTGATISIRDIIAWVQFVNATHGFLGRKMSLYHGAMMVYVDGIGATSGTEFLNISSTKGIAVDRLGRLLDGQFTSLLVTDVSVFLNNKTKSFFLGEFGLAVGFKKQTVPFSFASPTTIKNGMKVLRAMQLPKSILLEGVPGIGKTTLIQAIADMAGRPLTRINLSDQTDLMDLFGADAPVEGGRGGEFAWRDAPFLRAMQSGEWVLLDELNLASQSVLEGLNACLDHRGTAFVPELNRSFIRHPEFRIFAAQNPHVQGGGRKGLPKSFINRFSVVYVDALQERDMCIIGHHLFPEVDKEIIAKLIHYVAQLQEDANSNTPFGSLGRPWEFNLRDVLRWLELVGDQLGIRRGRSPGDYLHVLISQRLRSQKDREHAESLYEKSVSVLNTLDPTYSLAPDSIQFGLSVCPRESTTPFDRLLPEIPVELHRPMEALGFGIEKRWPVILAGPSGSGKTMMIRTFAALHGASLREISMNSDTDAMDLVGGYEQYDMVRQTREISGRIKEGIRRLIQSAGPDQITQSECTKLFAIFSDLSSSRFNGQTLRSTLKSILTGIQGRLPDGPTGPLASQIHEILTTGMSENANGKFQWYDGTLVDSLIHGDWVVLDNANLCNPSVLDRLNSLLEPNGSLVLHECTNPDGEPRVIKPHASFRLFLSMDPRHGELSRAMRNRALEIALLTAPKSPLPTVSPFDCYMALASNMRSVEEVVTSVVETGAQFAPTYHQIVEYSSFRGFPYLKRFVNSFHVYEERMRPLTLLCETLTEKVCGLLNLSAFNTEYFGRLGMPETFSESQALQPFLNDYILPNRILTDAPVHMDGYNPTATVSQTLVVFECLVALVEMNMFLEDIKRAAAVQDSQESRPLVLARKSLESPDYTLKSAIASLEVMESFRNCLRRWFEKNQYKSIPAESFPEVRKLAALWFDMASILNEPDVDRSYYKVFGDILKTEISRAKGGIYLTIGFLMNMETLGINVDLMAGTCMSAIWEVARPWAPTTPETWVVYDEIVSAIAKFEGDTAYYMGNPETLDAICSLRSSFRQLIGELQTQNQFAQRPQIPMFQTPTLPDDSQLLHQLRPAFKSLYHLVQFDTYIDDHPTKDLEMLAHLNGESLLRPLQYESSFATAMQLSLPTEDILSIVSGINLLKGSYNMSFELKNSTLKDFQRTKWQVKSFGRLLAQNSGISAMASPGIFASIIEADILEMCAILAQSDRVSNTLRAFFGSIGEDPIVPTLEDGIIPAEDSAVGDILAALQSIAASRVTHRNSLDRMLDIAHAFSQFSAAFVSLYIPDKPFDPASEIIVRQKMLTRRRDEGLARLESRTAIENRIRGTASRARIHDSERLDSAIEALETASRTRVVRPTISQISPIHEDFQYVVNLMAMGWLNDPNLTPTQVSNVLANLERVANRFLVNYPMYRDLLLLPSHALSRLVFGVRMKLEVDSMVSLNGPAFQPLCDLLSMDRLTQPLTSDIWNASRPKGERRTEMEYNLFSLQVILLSSKLRGLPGGQVPMVGEILDDCYREWRISKERQKLDQAAKTDIYKRNDTEYDLENAVAEFFPDQPLETSAPDASSKSSEEEMSLSVYHLHRKLFGSDKSPLSPRDIDRTLMSGYKFTVANANTRDLNDVVSISYPAQILTLASALREQPSPVDPAQYDFYRSANLDELETFVAVLSSTSKRVTAYLDAWPENAILGDIFTICDKIHGLPATLPLSRVLPYVERFYATLDQWQKVASRDYTLAEFHQKVKETIVRWRKLELGSWRTLMAEEEKKHRDQVSMWWFDIYELVLYNARNQSIDVPDYVPEVVAAVNDFILSSSVGDFEDRLQLVLSFANHAQHEVPSRPKMEAISRLCHHLYQLHSVHATSVRDTLLEQRKFLEKEVAETVQLASWRDTSVYALTESAKRSHYRLYKTIRKFRELLSKPVGPILQAAAVISLKNAGISTSPTLSQSIDSSKSYVDDLITSSAKTCELGKVWSPHGRIFSDPMKLSSSVAQIFSRVCAQSHELPIVVEEFIDTIETLAKQTPSTLTKENERQVKFLKTQKRRLFAQTMKELREWGISSRLSTHSNTSYILQLQATPVAPHGSASLSSSSVDLFYRILDVLPKLRQASVDHSQDLTNAESQRALGYVENLVDEVFASRSLLFELSNSVHTLKTKLESTLSMFVKHAAETESLFVSPNAPAPVNSRRILLRKIDVVIDTSISVLHAHHELTTADDITPILSYLQVMQTSCRGHSTTGADLPFNDEIVYQAGVKWCNEVDKWFFECQESLTSLTRQHRGFTYVFNPIVRSLEEIRSVDNMVSELADSKFDFHAFQSQAEALGASCLVASQELSKSLDTFAVMSTTRLQGKQFFRSVARILQSPSFVERMAATHREAIVAVKSPDQLTTVLAVTTCLLPVLEQFISGCLKVLDRISGDHNQLSRMTLVLMTAFHTLATKGYCSPQPASKEQGGKTADGVGLGEGEGETDITDQLKGDQEGLDELDHGEKGERKDERGEEDEEGLEMDEDFEGELEDAEDEERDEEDEEGESGDEMDEGTGAVDDLDPSAVDEQFWNDQSHQPDTAQDEKQMEEKNQKEEKAGELGAGRQDEMSKDDLETSMEDKEELKEGESGEESGDEDVQNREDDSRMPEAEPLDLPDDLDLNQPDGDKKEEDILSDDGLELDDEMEVDGGQGEEAENVEEGEGEDEDGAAEDTKMSADDEAETEAPEEGVDFHQPDRTEYQGDDVVPSDAAGKGGENAAEDTTAAGQESAETAENATAEEPPASIAQVGASRSADPTKEVQPAPRNADEHQSSERSESTPNPFRQLADQLEQWRRDLRNVQEVASEDANQEKTVGDANPDFSYVGEDEKWNDQALGPAAQDQIQPLDMSMAIDENESPPEPNPANNEARAEQQADQTDSDGRPQAFSSGAFIGQPVVTISASDDVDVSDFNPDGTSDELLEPRGNTDARIESTEIPEEARQTWRRHDGETHDLSLSLCEQLRLILEPTQATKMRGDFRTGKRLNMRRIIPYIASDYKKDKIWMRRTKPSKRQYQVMIAMDDSKSMSDSKSVKLAFDTLALTAKALSQLEVGQISIVRFGEDVKVIHAFEEPFNTESGGKVVHHFKFDQSRTDVAALTKASIDLFNVARTQQDVRSVSGSELWQLQLIISDGICEDHESIRRLVREALDSRIMMIFVILDAIHPERKDSILDIKSYAFEAGENGQVLRESRYLDSFPFSYFVIVRDIRELPLVLASALRQWFAEVAER